MLGGGGWGAGSGDQTSCLPQFDQMVNKLIFPFSWAFLRLGLGRQMNPVTPNHQGLDLGLMEPQLATKLMSLVFSDII